MCISVCAAPAHSYIDMHACVCMTKNKSPTSVTATKFTAPPMCRLASAAAIAHPSCPFTPRLCRGTKKAATRVPKIVPMEPRKKERRRRPVLVDVCVCVSVIVREEIWMLMNEYIWMCVSWCPLMSVSKHSHKSTQTHTP